MRAIRQGVRSLLAVVSGLAAVVGVLGLIGIAYTGITTGWQNWTRSPNPMDVWLGLLLLVCAGYVAILVVWGMKATAKGLDDEKRRYAELYAAVMQLRGAGQTLMDATTRGSHDEVISAKLRWHDAVAVTETFRPPSAPG